METRVLSFDDPAYPEELRALERPPSALRLRGELPRVPGVAVVGTREPSPESTAYAFELAAKLASAGLAVWSGGALGIDQAAHEGALSVGGLTVLVTGAGLDRPYPPGVEPLFARSCRSGALASIVPDDTPPLRSVFLARNGVLAAMTRATVIVECPVQSGARSTSAAARRLRRPVWMVAHPPWFVAAAAAVREEVRLGARPLFHVDDLLRSLDQLSLFADAPTPATVTPAPAPASPSAPLASPSLERVLAAIDEGATHLDELCERLSMMPSEVQVALTTLTLGGHVREVSHGAFSRSRLRNHWIFR